MNSWAVKRTPLKILAVALLFSLIVPIFLAQPVSASSTYEKTYEWDYDGHHWTWTLDIPAVLYDAYREIPESTRDSNGIGGYGYLTTTKDTYVRMLAEKLNETTNDLGYSSFDQVSFILAFVQSLPYTSDSVTTGFDNYPRFPVETLVDDGGDCEDTAILFATLTLILGYGTVYINPEGHLAVGILGDNLGGSYYTYNDKTYYYCETTGDGWTIGELPDEWKDQTAHIYTINTNQQFTPNVRITTPTPSPRPTTVVTVQPSVAPPTSYTNTVDDPIDLDFDTLLIVIFAVFIVIVIIGLLAGKRNKKPATPVQPTQQPIYTQPPPPPPTNAVASSNKFCINCGAPNSNQAAFCGNCGKPLS